MPRRRQKGGPPPLAESGLFPFLPLPFPLSSLYFFFFFFLFFLSIIIIIFFFFYFIIIIIFFFVPFFRSPYSWAAHCLSPRCRAPGRQAALGGRTLADLVLLADGPGGVPAGEDGTDGGPLPAVLGAAAAAAAPETPEAPAAAAAAAVPSSVRRWTRTQTLNWTLTWTLTLSLTPTLNRDSRCGTGSART